MADASGAAIANAAGSIAAPFVQGAFTLGGIALQAKYNKQLAAIQNQYNIDMWNRQNEYNSPQAQMQRFSEAGLNPNLIYGQGNSGNATSAPVQVAPEPVRIDRAMQELGRAFNIQNLVTGYAKMREALADARVAETNAKREEAHFIADKELGATYDFDSSTGKYVQRPIEGWYSIDQQAAAEYYKMQHLQDNYSRTHLIIPREAYLNAQRNYLAPQTRMMLYEEGKQPITYWIGQGSRVAQSIGNLIPKLKFSFGGSSGGGRYTAPNGRSYYY